MTAMTNGIFGVIFFNTALVPLLANSFLTPYGYKFNDYSPQWYATVG